MLLATTPTMSYNIRLNWSHSVTLNLDEWLGAGEVGTGWALLGLIRPGSSTLRKVSLGETAGWMGVMGIVWVLATSWLGW